MEGEPAKAATGGRRGFGRELFGRGGRRNNNNAGGRGRGEQQQQQWTEGMKGEAGGRELARSPGSPSFRYYCDDVVVVAATAKRKGKDRR